MLLGVLSGFERLFRWLGPFKLSEEMVGIDRDGRVKVWMNPNLSKNEMTYTPEVNRAEISS